MTRATSSSDSHSTQSTPSISDSDSEEAFNTLPVDEQGTQPRYPTRERRPPNRFGRWASPALEKASKCHGSPPTLTSHSQCHATAVEDMDSPTLKQALNSSEKEQWVEAIAEELESLREAGTWEIVPRAPPGNRVFPSKFVLKIKRNADRTIERYKARLVLLGHLQRQNIDYFETYSPVVDFTAVRTALTIACQEGMIIHHLDVKCAFLYGSIEEEIYMQLPLEYQRQDGGVCLLLKSIYGLKQAPRMWNIRLSKDLMKHWISTLCKC